MSSVSRGLEFWSVNRTSLYKISNNWPNSLLKTKVYKTLEFADIYYWKYYNRLMLLQWFLNDARSHHFHFSYILLSVLPSNFIVSGIKSSRYYSEFILYVIVFSILFIYIFIEGLIVFSPFFLRYAQNNLECLI